MRNKRLINKLNLTIVYVVSAVILVMGISFAYYYDYNYFNDTFDDQPYFNLYSEGSSLSTAKELKRVMSPMSDEEARIGELFQYDRYDKYSTGGSPVPMNVNQNEAVFDFDFKNETGKDLYYAIVANYPTSNRSYSNINNSYSSGRLKDNFVKFDVKEYNIDFPRGMYDVKYLIKGQSFDNLNNQPLIYFKVLKDEVVHKTFTINTWIGDDIRICNDGTCDYTSSKFNKLKADINLTVNVYDSMDKEEKNTTDLFTRVLKTRYTSVYSGDTNIDYVEEIDIKKMPLKNILNRYNDADYKVMIDSNTYSWYEKLEDGTFYKCIIASDKTMISSSAVLTSVSVFRDYEFLRVIDINPGSLDTSNLTDASYLFANCSNLQYIMGFDRLDFSNLTSMDQMFYNDYSLVHIEFGGELNNVVSMTQTFFYCFSLSILDLTMIDLSKVKSTSEMFCNCSNLVQIYTDTNFSSEGSSTSTFRNCFSLIGNVVYNSNNIDYTFGNYETGYFLKPADISPNALVHNQGNTGFWDSVRSIVTNSGVKRVIATTLDRTVELYEAAVNAGRDHVVDANNSIYVWIAADDPSSVFISTKKGYLSLLNTSLVPNINSALNQFIAYNVKFTTLEEAFSGLSYLKTLDLGYANTSMVTSYKRAFRLTGIATINTYDLITDSATDLSYMFYGKRLDNYYNAGPFSGSYGNSAYTNLNYLNTIAVTNIEGMFMGLSVGSRNILPYAFERYNGINGSSITDMSFLYSDHYTPYYNIVIPNIGLSKVEEVDRMFNELEQADDRSLKLDVSNINFNANPNIVRKMDYFMGFVYFDVIDISGFNSSSHAADPLGYDDVFMLACTKLVARNCDFSGLTSKIDSEYMKDTYFRNFKYVNNMFMDEEILERIGIMFDLDLMLYDEVIKLNVNFDEHFGFFAPDQYCYDLVQYMDFSNSKFANSMCGLFYGFTNLTYLNLYNVDTSGVTDMSCLFFGDSKLTTLDLSSFKYNNCRSMSGMFSMVSVFQVNLKNLETTKRLEDMSYMLAASFVFYDISSMNTDNVRDMSGLFFAGMYDVGMIGFCNSRNTSKVENFSEMFANCSSTIINISSFDTRNGTNFDYMFADCSYLNCIYVGEYFVNNSGREPVNPFANSYNLSSGYYDYDEDQYYFIYASDYMDENDQLTEDLFYIPDSTHLGLLSFDGAVLNNFYDNYTNNNSSEYQSAFQTGIREIVIEPLSQFEFYDHYDEEDIGTPGAVTFVIEDDVLYIHINEFDYGRKIFLPPDSSSFFKGMTALEKITGMEYISTYVVEDCSEMFAGCTSLQELDLNWDMHNVLDMSNMFNGCTNLEYARIGGLKTYNVENMDQMFYGCTKLKVIDLTGFVTPNLTSMVSTFENCTILKMVFVGDGWDNSSVSSANTFKNTNIYSMNDDGDFLLVDSRYYSGTYARKSSGSNIGLFSDKHNYMINPWFNFSVLSDAKNTATAVYFEDKFKNDISTVYDISLMHDNSIRLYVSGTSYYFCAETESYLPVDSSLLFTNFVNITTINWNGKNISSKYTYTTNSMFSGCTRMNNINFIQMMDTRNCTDFGYMFSGCVLTSSVDISHLNVSHAVTFEEMFSYCSGVNNIRMSGWHFENNVNMNKMFYSCTNLNKLYASLNWNGDKVTSAVGALDGVSSSFQAARSSAAYDSLSTIRTTAGLTQDGNNLYDYASVMNVISNSNGVLTPDLFNDGYSFR